LGGEGGEGETRHSIQVGGEGKGTCWEARGETRHSILPSETEFEVVVLKGFEEEKVRMERRNPRRRKKGWSDAIFSILRRANGWRRWMRIDVIWKRRKLRDMNSRSISSVFIADLPP
jgi:hypothetical protein